MVVVLVLLDALGCGRRRRGVRVLTRAQRGRSGRHGQESREHMGQRRVHRCAS